MSNRIAEKDITEVNSLGQTVVVVPKGQRVPDGIEPPAAADTTGSPAGDAPTLDAEEARARLTKTSDDELKAISEMVADELADRSLEEAEKISVPEAVVPGATPGWPLEDGELVELSNDERWAAVTEALADAQAQAAEAEKKLEEQSAIAPKKPVAKAAQGKGKKGK